MPGHHVLNKRGKQHQKSTVGLAQMEHNLGWHAHAGGKLTRVLRLFQCQPTLVRALRYPTVGAAGSGMDKASKGQEKLEESGGGLLPAVEGHNLE